MIKVWGLAMLILASVLSANPDASLAGESLVTEGKYQEALAYYQALDMHPDNPRLNYNLGTVYGHLGEVGESILHLQKAKEKWPRHRHIRHNLAYMNRFVVAKPSQNLSPIDSITRAMASRVSLAEMRLWLWISVALLLGVFTVPQLGFSLPNRKMFLLAFSTLLLLSGLAFLGVNYQNQVLEKGVIIVKKEAVRSGPSASLDQVFFVHEGVQFTILRSLDDWHECLFENGLTGWLQKDAFWTY